MYWTPGGSFLRNDSILRFALPKKDGEVWGLKWLFLLETMANRKKAMVSLFISDSLGSVRPRK